MVPYNYGVVMYDKEKRPTLTTQTDYLRQNFAFTYAYAYVVALGA